MENLPNFTLKQDEADKLLYADVIKMTERQLFLVSEMTAAIMMRHMLKKNNQNEVQGMLLSDFKNSFNELQEIFLKKIKHLDLSDEFEGIFNTTSKGSISESEL